MKPATAAGLPRHQPDFRQLALRAKRWEGDDRPLDRIADYLELIKSSYEIWRFNKQRVSGRVVEKSRNVRLRNHAFAKLRSAGDKG